MRGVVCFWGGVGGGIVWVVVGLCGVVWGCVGLCGWRGVVWECERVFRSFSLPPAAPDSTTTSSAAGAAGAAGAAAGAGGGASEGAASGQRRT